MNPLVHRHDAAVDNASVPADAPMQVPPLTEEAAHTLGADDSGTRFQGDLFLPGWLRIELQPSAEQGPGA